MTSLFPLIYSCLGLGFLSLSLSVLRPQGGGGGGGNDFPLELDSVRLQLDIADLSVEN